MSNQEKIGDIFEFIRNGASIKQLDGKGGIPITRIETIWDGSIDKNRFGYADIFENSIYKYEKYFLRRGDILMSHINSPKHLGKCAIYNGIPESLIHGMNLLCLRGLNHMIFPRYAMYFFQSIYFKGLIRKISNQSVNQASFSTSKLKDLKIPLPPLPTQKKNAAILDNADELRRNDQKILKKYDELAQSVFLEMFGDPVTNPKGEKIVRLIDVATKITDGVHAKPDYTEKGIPFISVKDITTGRLKFDNCKYISEIDHNKYFKRCNPELDDILYTKVGATYGRPAIVDQDINFSLYVSVALIKPRKELVNTYYLKEAMANPAIKRQADRAIKGIGVPDLHLNMIKEFVLPLPDLNSQHKFANIIKQIEKQRELTQQSLQKSEDLFQSLLQRAFRGELV